jgi:hypothetical protein
MLWALGTFAQGTQTVTFQPDANGLQTLTGNFADVNASLLVQLLGMKAGNTLAIQAQGDPSMDFILQLDSAFDMQILNNSAVGQDELYSYTFPADGDYNLSLFSLTTGGAYSLRLAVRGDVPVSTTSEATPATAIDPLRPNNFTEQQLQNFNANDTPPVPQVQTLNGTLKDALDEVRVPLGELRVGDTVYALARGQGMVNAFLALFDDRLVTRYAQDDNGGGGTDAALQFVVETNGVYVLSFFSATGGGDYTLTYGVNTPEILEGVTATTTNTQNTSNFFISRGANAQRFQGTMTTADTIRIGVKGVRVGDVIYAAATGRGNFDPVLTLYAPDGTLIATDDNGGGGVVALLNVTSPVDGNLTLELTANQDGGYRVLAGINTPTVLDSVGMAQDSNIVGGEFRMAAGQTREFGGQMSSGFGGVAIYVSDVKAGDTLYVLAEGLNGIDPYAYLFSPDFQYILAEDDNSGGGTTAALSFTVEDAGEYALYIDSETETVGGFRVVVGTNDPTIFSDVTTSNISAIQEAGFDCSKAVLNERPELSGAVKQIAATNSIIHYTTQGADATTDDYAAVASEAIENSLNVQFGVLGWRKPPNDCGLGGDDRLDVYIQDIEFTGAIGYASPENMVADNPNTPERELYSAFSHLVLENDMGFLRDMPELTISALDLLRVTAAHEVHHNIQFGYDTNETYYGIYEAGAVWIETLVYPTITDAFQYEDVFLYPDLCIGSRSYEAGLRVYGEWVMVDSFVRDNGATSYQQLWEYLSTRNDMEGFFDGLEKIGTTVETVVRRMAIRNLLMDYQNSSRFVVPIAVSGFIRGAGNVESGERGTQQQSVDYLRLVSGVWTINVTSGSNISLSVVGIDRATNTATSYTLGTRGTVDTTKFDAAYVIVQNTTRYRNTDECYYANWTLAVNDGTGQPLTPPDAEVWSAANYRDIAP